jgi:hypothetical protein
MAFAYLDRLDLHGDAELVSNNHFDQDGLVSVLALSQPELAVAHRGLLFDVAAAGDFATYRSRTAARISITLAGVADDLRSPLAIPEDGDRIGASYTESVARMPELIERYSDLWGGHRFAGFWMNGLHPMAICNATERLGILTARGGSFEFAYRSRARSVPHPQAAASGRSAAARRRAHRARAGGIPMGVRGGGLPDPAALPG